MDTSVLERPLSKKERRKLRQAGQFETAQAHRPQFKLLDVEPLTANQLKVFDAYNRGSNLLLHGTAGTGKTFIAMYKALEEVMSGDTLYDKVVIVRSVVPTRDIGALPGSYHEKTEIYELPYRAIATELFNRGDAYMLLKQKQILEFISTSYIRGTTMRNCIMIVDEINNMTFHELDSVITRMGTNCKVIMCGDLKQSDLTKEHERAGLGNFMKILKKMKYFEHVEFNQDDIVRGGVVKEYICVREALGLQA